MPPRKKLSNNGGHKPPIKNIANTIATRYGNDGQVFVDEAGVKLVDALKSMRTTSYSYKDGIVYEFTDESALVLTEGAWDTVAWDADSESFFSVLPDGTRNAHGWVFKA